MLFSLFWKESQVNKWKRKSSTDKLFNYSCNSKYITDYPIFYFTHLIFTLVKEKKIPREEWDNINKFQSLNRIIKTTMLWNKPSLFITIITVGNWLYKLYVNETSN